MNKLFAAIILYLFTFSINAFEIKTPSERVQEVFEEYGKNMSRHAEERQREIHEGFKQQSEQRKAEQEKQMAEKEKENRLKSPKCQFWMQQEQNERSIRKQAEHCQ
jgi:hypothetical protein